MNIQTVDIELVVLFNLENKNLGGCGMGVASEKGYKWEWMWSKYTNIKFLKIKWNILKNSEYIRLGDWCFTLYRVL